MLLKTERNSWNFWRGIYTEEKERFGEFNPPHKEREAAEGIGKLHKFQKIGGKINIKINESTKKDVENKN